MSVVFVYRKPENMPDQLWALLARMEKSIGSDPRFKKISFLPEPEPYIVSDKTRTVVPQPTKAVQIFQQFTSFAKSLTQDENREVLLDGTGTNPDELTTLLNAISDNMRKTLAVPGEIVRAGIRGPKGQKKTSKKNTGWKRKK